MRRSMLSVFALAVTCSAVVGCSADDSPGVVTSRAPKSAGADTPAGGQTGGTATTDALPCDGIAEPKQIANDVEAADLRLTDGAIIFRSGTKVVRAAKDGSGQVTLYDSPNLKHAHFADGLIITIEEQLDNPNAVIKVTTIDDPNQADPNKIALNGATIATNFNAGGSYFIGSDADAVYLVGDEAQGEVIYKLSREVAALQPLVTVTDSISSAQIATGGLWYVRDRSRVFEIPLAVQQDPNNPDQKAAGEPREIFGSTAQACALAVGQDDTFCSTGSLLERRDLKGSNLKTVLEATKSKIAAPFGFPTWSEGTLYVRTSQPDAKMNHAVRAIKPNGTSAEERIVACNRTSIAEVAVDKENVVWTEPGKGVFMAPR